MGEQKKISEKNRKEPNHAYVYLLTTWRWPHKANKITCFWCFGGPTKFFFAKQLARKGRKDPFSFQTQKKKKIHFFESKQYTDRDRRWYYHLFGNQGQD